MSDDLPAPGPDENRTIAVRLREYADLLEQQADDGFRIRAYRAAADAAEALHRPLRDIRAEGGIDALIALPKIGRGIAGAISAMLDHGVWPQLDRLRGEATPERLLRTIPGIGAKLASRIASEADIETLEDLESVLRLSPGKLPFIGPRRRTAILDTLSARLGRMRRPTARPAPSDALPPVSLLLDADQLYRSRAEAGTLRLIAPRRFNPTGEAWLPVMHARRDDWHLTALFSNTAQAHELGRTKDWVVVYFHRTGETEARATIVTETHGALAGKRVVRGREAECATHYGLAGV